ncbi:MAG: hypothetical protein AB1756_05190 [Acidobacteriota bacterium]
MSGRNCTLFFSFIFLACSAFIGSLASNLNADPGYYPAPELNREEAARQVIDSVAYAINSPDPPVDCATISILNVKEAASADDSRFNPFLKYLMTKPSLQDESIHRTPEGNFLIHYTKDRGTIDAVPLPDHNKNSIPDYVETIGEALEEARRFYIEMLGYRNPIDRFAPGKPCEVFVLNLGGKATGATIPVQDVSSSSENRAASFIMIDNMILGDSIILKSSAAHQYAHAITLAYSLKNESWWTEAAAIWLEDRLYHTLPKYLDSIAFRLHSKGKALNTDDIRLFQGNTLWTFFLGEKDVNLVRKIWEEMELFPEASLLEVFAKVLEREGHGTLQENFSDYAIWNHFTGSRDDGNHFLFAGLLPDPEFDSSYSCYPVAGIQVDNPLESLGMSFIRFESERTRGALIVSFDGDQSCRWDVDMLIVSDNPPYYFKAKMDLSPAGYGTIGVPWERVSEVIMIVKNIDCKDESSGKYSYMASHDPSYPFEFNFFNTSEEDGKIAILWETGSETNLYGWNVYRSVEPEKNFSRINEIIIPALGDSSTPIIYKFIDDSARGSVKYYYYVEGVTCEGLSSRSFVSSTQIKK